MQSRYVSRQCVDFIKTQSSPVESPSTRLLPSTSPGYRRYHFLFFLNSLPGSVHPAMIDSQGKFSDTEQADHRSALLGKVVICPCTFRP
jgi:hypothetical protein